MLLTDLSNIIKLLIIISIPLLFINSMIKPFWVDLLKENWLKININSSIFSLIIGLSGIFFINLFKINNIINNFIVLSTMILVYILNQSFYTDFKLRLVDRFIIYLGILLLIFPSLQILNNNGVFVESLIILFLGFIIFFLTPNIGWADVLALVLINIILLPTSGIKGLIFSILLTSIIINIYNNISRPNLFLKEISIPAVPFILLPPIIINIVLFSINLIN